MKKRKLFFLLYAILFLIMDAQSQHCGRGTKIWLSLPGHVEMEYDISSNPDSAWLLPTDKKMYLGAPVRYKTVIFDQMSELRDVYDGSYFQNFNPAQLGSKGWADSSRDYRYDRPIEINNSFLEDFSLGLYDEQSAYSFFGPIVLKNCIIRNFTIQNAIFKNKIILSNCVVVNFNIKDSKFLDSATFEMTGAHACNRNYQIDKLNNNIVNNTFEGPVSYSIDSLIDLSENNSTYFGDVSYSFTDKNRDTITNLHALDNCKFLGVVSFQSYSTHSQRPIVFQGTSFRNTSMESKLSGAPLFINQDSTQKFDNIVFAEGFEWFIHNYFGIYQNFLANNPSIYQIENTKFTFIWPTTGFDQLLNIYKGHEFTYRHYIDVKKQFQKVKQYVVGLNLVDKQQANKVLNRIDYQEKVYRIYYLTDNWTIKNTLELLWYGFLWLTLNLGYEGEWNFIISCLLIILLCAFWYKRKYKREIQNLIGQMNEDKNASKVNVSFFTALWFSAMIFISIKWNSKLFHYSGKFVRLVLAEWLIGIFMFILFFVFIASKYPFVKDLIGI